LTVCCRTKGGVTHTKSVSFPKNQIQVRTFADWDDVSPGFFEVDLVAHCGGDPNGAFLNTLTMVDVAIGWLECMPLLKKSANDVITGVSVAMRLIPFDLKGLDTDGGSEFINHELLEYCEKNSITFTRARTHKKNDQVFVEEKNGSVVRRLVGYDLFQGTKSWAALANFYQILRQCVNFFSHH
jgi:IS30 family transposase